MAVSFIEVGKRLWQLATVVWLVILGLSYIVQDLLYLVFPRPRKDIKNDIVLVTGSGQGLGRELALQFARQGCEVVCVDVDPALNLATVKLILSQGGKARAYVCNVADREAVMKLGKEVGRVDILVNNAGVYPVKSLWNATEEEMRTILDVNLFSQFWTVQAFLPAMKGRDHGHVVCISSLSGLVGFGYMVPYAVSKFGIAGLMASLSQELQTEKINVKLTTVFPYFINTRAEIKECVKARVPPLATKDTAETILHGVLENIEYLTVPRALFPILNIIRFLPTACQEILTENFPIRIKLPKHDDLREMMERGVYKKSGCITAQGVC